ncbi:hypothetical protein TcasGA2_TC011246 [Tribolium castaneum]|uniref:Uncharacterized protein n=1 Tax=Tribolium castaneum TaxID=7070 RepID=D6X3G4_TRICA|nr:hypothetical protein TcasGA2_TC011246 [Tribolium castaneum]
MDFDHKEERRDADISLPVHADNAAAKSYALQTRYEC